MPISHFGCPFHTLGAHRLPMLANHSLHLVIVLASPACNTFTDSAPEATPSLKSFRFLACGDRLYGPRANQSMPFPPMSTMFGHVIRNSLMCSRFALVAFFNLVCKLPPSPFSFPYMCVDQSSYEDLYLK